MSSDEWSRTSWPQWTPPLSACACLRPLPRVGRRMDSLISFAGAPVSKGASGAQTLASVRTQRPPVPSVRQASGPDLSIIPQDSSSASDSSRSSQPRALARTCSMSPSPRTSPATTSCGDSRRTTSPLRTAPSSSSPSFSSSTPASPSSAPLARGNTACVRGRGRARAGLSADHHIADCMRVRQSFLVVVAGLATLIEIVTLLLGSRIGFTKIPAGPFAVTAAIL